MYMYLYSVYWYYCLYHTCHMWYIILRQIISVLPACVYLVLVYNNHMMLLSYSEFLYGFEMLAYKHHS